MRGLDVRPTLSARPLALCILGALLVPFQLAMGSGSGIPAAGPGLPVSRRGQLPIDTIGTGRRPVKADPRVGPTAMYGAQGQSPAAPPTSPPWLTLRDAWLGLGVMAGLILGAVGWAVLLRQRVSEQTALIREQLRREAALKESYQELFENARDVVFTCGLRGHITSLNCAGERLLLRTREAVIGRHITEILTPESGEKIKGFFNRELPDGSPRTVEVDLLSEDGKRVPVEVSLRPILNDGYTVGWQGIARDVSERKRAEAERAYLAFIVESSNDAIVGKSPDGIIQTWNLGAERLYGYTAAEVVGQPISLLVPPEESEELASWLDRIRRGERVEQRETVRLRKDGRRINVSVSISPVKDANGRVIGAATITRDITERTRGEEARTLLASIVESTDDAIVGATPDGTIVSWNRGAEDLHGYTAEEVRGKPVSMLLPPAELDKLRQDIEKLGRGERIPPIDRMMITKDGRPVDVSITVTPLKHPAGRVVGFSAIIRDITERKRAAQALQEAKEAAEAASRAKSQFLASMSHEIRTPMNGIIGMTELALETELTPEQRDYLVMVRESADALLTIINDILDFSRIEAGKLGLDLSEFDLTELVGSTLKGLAVRAHQKGLELAFHIAPELPAALVGDAGRLRQVLVNLIGNAIKFTEQGEVALTVEAESPVDNAVLVRFRVADTGIGIPEAQRRKIFEAFAQGDSSTTRKYGGTGLGLSISSRLVEMMGGRIWVESEVGRGSDFNFTARLGLHAPQPPKDLPEELASLRALPVLVVDDNATSRRMLAAMLQHWGMKATLAESGPAALAALARAKEEGNAFPCVVIDAQMPGMDGFMLAQRLLGIGDSGLGVGRNPNPESRNPSQCGIIMMLTTTHQRDDAARCRELGITTDLVKPFLPRELLAAFLAALGTPGVELSVSPSVDGSGDPSVDGPSEQRVTGVTPPSGGGRGAGGRNLRVLVVEDSAVNRQLIVRLLEKRGHTSEIAANGREALAILERAGLGSFDLVLMDVQMPEMDGFEATAAIREWEKAGGTHLPIIALTAYALQGDLERCLAAGMDGYIPKPVRAGELFSAVEGLLEFAAEEAAGAQEGRRGRERRAE